MMIKKIETEIVIEQTPQKIWKILTDFENYGNWNPFIKSITGKVEIKNIIKISIQSPNSSKMIFKLRVLTKVDNVEISWLGSILFKGLFDGNHKFELIDNYNGTTTFKHSEEFSGIFAQFFNPENTKKGFILMNEELKKIAEE